MIRCLCACLALLLLLPVRPLAAQIGQTADILRGRVLDEQNRPVVGAQVEAVSLESEVRRVTVTGRDGRYTIVFPDGGGRYHLRIGYPGMAPAVLSVAREADEDVLLANAQLRTQAVALEGIAVRAQRPPPGRGEAGATERTLSGEAASRLPLDNPTDLATLATLSPGVVAVDGADSLDARGSFSVAGQLASLNQITLDGATFGSLLSGGQFGGSPLGLPQEGVRATQVVTNTFDVSRGQFAGGQIATTTRAGTNRVQGSGSYQLRDDALQGGLGRGAWSGGFTQQRVSGGVGGPVVRDRLFYNLSFSAQQRADALFALSPRDASGWGAMNASADSVARFFAILQQRYGITPEVGAYERTSDALSLLARVDYALAERHTLALRGHGSASSQDNARIGVLELMQNGGETGTRSGGAMLTLTSRFGAGWIHELRASLTRDVRETDSYSTTPEGRVRIASVLEDGSVGIASLAFGGDRSLPSVSRERTLELSDEFSWLWGDTHRLKLGGFLNYSGFRQESGTNRLGSFSFHSLADLEAGRPASFSRALAARSSKGAGWNAGLYLGDSWRPTRALQFTYGLRLEGSGYGDAPAYDAAVDSAFGARTDRLPRDLRLSPRLGFSWRLNEQGGALRLLRGGVGEFRGRAPFSLYAGVLEQTGLTGGAAQLFCVGSAVPTPDWARFETDPASIPSACLDAGAGGGPQTGRGRAVSVFGEEFGAPRSWRASLGYQAQLRRTLRGSLDVSYARGAGLFGARDLNLREQPAFRLAAEGGRPVFIEAGGIVPRTGEVSLFGSRRDARFAQVFELYSGLESSTQQATLSLNGMLLPRRLSFQASYTLTRSRDEASFAGGSAQQGFAGTPTRGDPNRLEWAPSDMDRRHGLVGIVGLQLGPAAELALVGRASSGAPFTPLVGGDVNGDGARNDAAFVLDPAATTDAALAAAMRRVLDTAPGRVRDCLRAQLGELAARNSCRGPWTHSLDLRATLRPQLARLGLGRRLSLSADALNLGAGLDRLLHGAGDLRGWGQSRGRPDDVLLYPRGFDAATRQFRYEVNERFGQDRARRQAFGSPFNLQLSARVALGAQPGQAPIAALASGGPAGGGAGAGARRQARAEAGAEGRRRFEPDAFLARALPEPIGLILALRDTLKLTPEQTTRLQQLADSLAEKNRPIRDEVAAALAAAGEQATPGELFQRVGPRLNEGRRNVQAALEQARALLTPEQWRRLPASVRNAVRR